MGLFEWFISNCNLLLPEEKDIENPCHVYRTSHSYLMTCMIKVTVIHYNMSKLCALWKCNFSVFPNPNTGCLSIIYTT